MEEFSVEDERIEAPLDYDWVTERLAVGGAIWTPRNMEMLAALGITHVVDMQVEFDDTRIVGQSGVQVLWNPCDDDFQDKPPELFERGVEFATQAYRNKRSRIFFHCAAGIHRGPMMLLAFLGSQGMDLEQAIKLISSRRLQADFPEVYRNSVARFLDQISVSKDGLPR